MKTIEYIVEQGNMGELSLFFGGDTLIGASAKKILKEEGYDFPFKNVSTIYRHSDVRIINLESPICETSQKTSLVKQYKYKMSPQVLEPFEKNNFNLFLLANNHTTDCGLDGLLETIQLLSSKQMITLGAGRSLEEARRGIIIQKGTIKVGLLNYMVYKEYYDKELNHYANDTSGGVNVLSNLVYEDIRSIKEAGANTVIVSVHWGKNYKPITKDQEQFANLLIDAGADIIVGHGAHQYQPIRMIKGKLVFFSIGNFVFNTSGREPLTYGFPITLHITNKGINKIDVWPIATNNKMVHYQPNHLVGKEGSNALNELFGVSKIGSVIITRLYDHGIIYL